MMLQPKEFKIVFAAAEYTEHDSFNHAVDLVPSLLYVPGSSLGLDLNSSTGMVANRRCGLVVRAAKYALCQTKRNRSRNSLARTHGFRKRMSTTRGRAVIRRRRAKGQWNLCTKSNPNSGKRA